VRCGLLSYSPKQEVHSFAERALMPVIFAELAMTYRRRMSAIRSRRWLRPMASTCWFGAIVYDAVGGHAAWRELFWRTWN